MLTSAAHLHMSSNRALQSAGVFRYDWKPGKTRLAGAGEEASGGDRGHAGQRAVRHVLGFTTLPRTRWTPNGATAHASARAHRLHRLLRANGPAGGRRIPRSGSQIRALRFKCHTGHAAMHRPSARGRAPRPMWSNAWSTSSKVGVQPSDRGKIRRPDVPHPASTDRMSSSRSSACRFDHGKGDDGAVGLLRVVRTAIQAGTHRPKLHAAPTVHGGYTTLRRCLGAVVDHGRDDGVAPSISAHDDTWLQAHHHRCGGQNGCSRRTMAA